MDRFISINKLADSLGGISRATIYRHIKNLDHFPKPVKVGSLTRFRQSDVEKFILGTETSEKEVVK